LRTHFNDEENYYAAKILYWHYLNDKVFPKSCSSVSMAMAYVLGKISKRYTDILYERGYYTDIDEYDGEEFNQPHSWISAYDTKTNERIIIDLTEIQFSKSYDACEPIYESYREIPLSSRMLYEIISNEPYVIVTQDSPYYNCYIPDYDIPVDKIIDRVDNDQDDDYFLYSLGYLTNIVKSIGIYLP
jgi:hypothetical protein